ncbi:MazG nucleotide pyrophosphohydrolase domain-containing protein [Halorubrum vacuolatum]|uniref:NTP pyrophosphatase, house-cleaning of non-canonical NTPs n=1 Tax=Halorubrum vacuolatum TaxID=63740 RepID=A0A238XKB5_HALVU|nr:MazG-like family protein [Halorubrum vacuolatum]SNR59456.1 NTP pyrophosphatase, house-cleaning of non-canonical NTPs [Halorubrum vacuolatum]
MEQQERVAAFIDRHGLDCPLAHRVLDLESEVGELAKEVLVSTDYGDRPDDAAIAVDELGDALFALLALAESAGVDAEEALDVALGKYRQRLDESGDAGSGA